MAQSYMVSIKLIITIVTTMILVNVMIVRGDKTWCVAKVDATNQQLLDALNYACRAGADCYPIQPNGSCYNPNTVESHASYAFNSFYQKNKQASGTCDFAGSAHVVSIDPSMNIDIQHD
ncbi:hypothetical protein RYX36_011555 [Vicia faba]